MKHKIKILIIDTPHSEIVKSIKEHILSKKLNVNLIIQPDFEPKKIEDMIHSDGFRAMIEQNRKEVDSWSEWKKNIVITAETASTGCFIKRKKPKKKK